MQPVLPSGVPRQVRQHRSQVQVHIRDVKSQQPSGCQFVAIELEGFPRQQMDWDGVRTVSVQHDQAVGMVRSLEEGKAGIAQDDLEVGWRIL